MPKTKFQDFIFTMLMVFVMVYAMIVYNIAINRQGMSNEVFLLAFHEPGGYVAFQKPRQRGDSSLAGDYSYQFPNGIMLADFLRRTAGA